MALHIIKHPLSEHMMTVIRNKNTKVEKFRSFVKKLTSFLVTETTRDLKLKKFKVQTPYASYEGKILDQGIVLIPKLRSGLGLVAGFLAAVPDAKIGYVGIEYGGSKEASEYYCKLPKLNLDSKVIILDPTIGTGNSINKVISALKDNGARNITVASMIVSKQGVKYILDNNPGVEIYAFHQDEKLNLERMLVPGLGDFGDRYNDTL